MTRIPRYPVYVISKGRHDVCLTAKFLRADKVAHKVVIEPQEFDLYAPHVGEHNLLVLPFSNLGLGSIPARNWVWEHSRAAGHERHWILDDNIRRVCRYWKGKRLPCASGPAFAAIEDFTDRYENLGVSGMNYVMFASPPNLPPYHLNVHVYSCLLIQNDLPVRWRGRYNEDTDLCLQVLSRGLCTTLTNAFLIEKMVTMKLKGGNAAELYKGDGRLKMARSLERSWPYVVETKRRFQRPQHVVRDSWKGFDTPLRLKPGIDLSKIRSDEYGLRAVAVSDVRSPRLKVLVDRGFLGSKEDK